MAHHHIPDTGNDDPGARIPRRYAWVVFALSFGLLLSDYMSRPALAAELFDHVAAGRIGIEIHQRYALQDAVQAHRDLESRKTTGSSIFVI